MGNEAGDTLFLVDGRFKPRYAYAEKGVVLLQRLRIKHVFKQ